MQTVGTNIEINGKSIIVEGEIPRIAKLGQEWFEDVENPEMLINALQSIEGGPDIFTFWQRLPDIEPKYSYTMEPDSIAALPIKSYSFWWEKQIDGAARNKVRKAQRKGIIVRPAVFDDPFVRGMTSIFNETPIRQGRRYLHYGKDFETVKQQFRIPYLAYAYWLDDGLGDFKRNNGFQQFDLPRYFVPLTRKGKLALKLGLHRRLKDSLPIAIKKPLQKLRKRWYNSRSSSANSGKESIN